MKPSDEEALFTRWAPYALAAILLLLDFVLLARALPEVRPGFDYGQWSLERGLYSDVLNLGLRHYQRMGHVIHPLPYVHDRIEYPVLLGFTLWLPSWLPGGPASWLAGAGVLTASATFGAVHLVRRIRPASAWWIAASPALFLDGAINWDLIGIFFLVAGVVWFVEGRVAWSGSATAVGTCFKLFPVVVAPMAAAALASRWWRRSRGWRDGADLARWFVPFVGICLVVFVPFLIVAPHNTWWFVKFNDLRDPKDSVFGLLGLGLPSAVAGNHFADTASLLAVVAAMAFGAWLVWRLPIEHQSRGVALGSALVVIVWMAVNKIWNPQYVLWVFAAGAIASLPAAFGLALGAFSIYDWWFEFHLRLPSRPSAFADVGHSSVAIRVVLFGLMAWWAGRELWRLAPRRVAVRTGRVPATSLR